MAAGSALIRVAAVGACFLLLSLSCGHQGGRSAPETFPGFAESDIMPQSLAYLKHLDALFEDAYKAFDQQKYDVAEQLFADYVAYDTSMVHYEAYAFLAECHRLRGAVDTGLEVYDKAIELARERKDRTQTAHRLQNHAVTELQEWRNGYPGFPPALVKENGFVPYDEPPQLKGGSESLTKHLDYPLRAKQRGIQGRVLIAVLVDKSGSPTEFRVAQSLDPDCDQAAIDAIRKIEFVPAKKMGRVVPAWFAIPVEFRMSQPGD
jgi:TonB family protein